MQRTLETFPHAVWLNPVREDHWRYTPSIGLLRKIMANRMYPLTLDGLDRAMKELSH